MCETREEFMEKASKLIKEAQNYEAAIADAENALASVDDELSDLLSSGEEYLQEE